jgi:molybdopterin converting factor small subunit
MSLRVRLAEPLREGVGEFVEITSPVANVGELIDALERRVPAFASKNDELFNVAVNGDLVLHGERNVPLQDGDEVELLVAFSGG